MSQSLEEYAAANPKGCRICHLDANMLAEVNAAYDKGIGYSTINDWLELQGVELKQASVKNHFYSNHHQK